MARRAEYLGPERRRPLVLDAALEIFAEGGFADASMQAVADRAGVSKAVLYDCFPSGKQEIYNALLERGEHTFVEHMTEALSKIARLPVDERLQLGISSFLEYAELHPHSFRVIFGDAGTRDLEIIRSAERTRERIIELLTTRTRDVMRRSGADESPIFDFFPRAIVAVSEEMARWLLRTPEVAREPAVQVVVTWMMKGFEALIPNEGWRGTRPV
ncbi:MAG: TetR/AcrR family transcriptional regulator [Actinomycetota bacterium]